MSVVEIALSSSIGENNLNKTKPHTDCCCELSLCLRFDFTFSLYANKIKVSRRIIFMYCFSVLENFKLILICIIKAVYRNTQPLIARRHTCYALKSNIHKTN